MKRTEVCSSLKAPRYSFHVAAIFGKVKNKTLDDFCLLLSQNKGILCIKVKYSIYFSCLFLSQVSSIGLLPFVSSFLEHWGFPFVLVSSRLAASSSTVQCLHLQIHCFPHFQSPAMGLQLLKVNCWIKSMSDRQVLRICLHCCLRGAPNPSPDLNKKQIFNRNNEKHCISSEYVVVGTLMNPYCSKCVWNP